MLRFAMIVGVVAGFLPVQSGFLNAQDIQVRVAGSGKVEVAPAVAPAPREIDAPFPDFDGDSTAMDEARRAIEGQARREAMLLADGDLNQDETNRLVKEARERLDRDLAKLEKRERDNARESNAKDRAEEANDIKKDRYRASVRALERDLLYRIGALRKPGGNKFEANLDNLQDKIKDTFADLQDKLDDDPPATYSTTLDVARKFYNGYLDQIDKWSKEIGVDASVPDADKRLKELTDDLVNRAKRLRKMGGNKYEDELDSTIDKVKDTFADLREKLGKTPPKGWADIVAAGEKFHAQFSADLDKWAKKLGADESLPSPTERLNQLSRDLLERIGTLRKAGGDKHEDALDGLEDKVRDTFADLKEKVLNQSKEHWARTLEDAARFHREYSEQIDLWTMKIRAGDKPVDRPRDPEPVPSVGKPSYPEKDLPLPESGSVDIVDGVRVARVGPLVRKQLGLENGLEVKEITDADGSLARLGLEVYDIIVEAKDVKVDTRSGLREVMDSIKRGQEYSIVILRDGKRQTLTGKR
ncbi:MAG: PDZ domain-containing protein [Planctomycetes bacterium]|nr:PDZ domain-containing protein [Planctomycetota bacterium]